MKKITKLNDFTFIEEDITEVKSPYVSLAYGATSLWILYKVFTMLSVWL